MAVMTFEDLPTGSARELDLSDHTHAVDVIDLITMDEDRRVGCFSAMLCDGENRGLQPICLNELGAASPADAMAELLELVLPLLAKAAGSILMARGRPGPLRATDEDRAWHHRAVELCRAHEVRLLGFHVATTEGVLRLPDPLDASAVA
jgi:hypothetical protein